MDQPSLLQSADLWAAVSFVLFIALVWWKGREPIRRAVNGRIARIRADIEQAENLRGEAEAMLAEIRRKQRTAADDAEDIIRNARDESKLLRDQYARRLKEMAARREAQALDQIARSEVEAINGVRALCAGIAVSAAGDIIRARMDGPEGAKMIDAAIAEAGALLD